MRRGFCVALLATLCVAAGAALAADAPRAWLLFKPVKTVADLEHALTSASATGRPVMVIIRADWSHAGLELERTTLTDPEVQAALKSVVQLRFDVTANDDEDKKLYAHLDIFGPPVVVLYGADGKERRNFRVLGFMKAAEFAAVIRQAIAPAN